MKVKGIPYSEVKAKALQNPDVMAAYLAEKKRRRASGAFVRSSSQCWH